jgi:hypothetical protein
MLQVLNDPKSSQKAKMWAANAAAPYIHRRMPIGIEGGDRDKPLVLATAAQLRQLSDEELDVLMKITGKFTHGALEETRDVENARPRIGRRMH